MKTIIRRASHGPFRYRTTDADGWQDLWKQRPVYHRTWNMWVAGRDLPPGNRKGYGPISQPPRTPHLAIVKIGPQK